jgi:hypothetical protein
MPEWLKVVIGVVALITAPIIPALYVEYLWVIGRDHDRSEATAENHSTERDQRKPVPSAAPVEPRATESNPISRKSTDQSGDSQMKLTDWLLVFVGLLQFGAIVGQIIIYRRQADIMGQQRRIAERALVLAQRPRIKVREIEPDFTVNHEWYFQEGEPVTGGFWIGNAGGSEAIVQIWRCHVWWSERGLPPAWPNIPLFRYEGSDDMPILTAGTHGLLKFQSPELMGKEGHDISTGRGDWRLYILGRITYADELGIMRTTAFCRRFQKQEEEAGRFVRTDDPDLEYED